MCSAEAIIRRDQPSRGDVDVEDTIFVAVGNIAAESMSALSWAKQSFPGKRMCLLHVRQPTHFAAPNDGKSFASKLRHNAAKLFEDLRRQRMHKLLNLYAQFLSQEIGYFFPKKSVDIVWTEKDCIEKGIVEIIVKHNVRWLVMGAAADRYYSLTMENLKSKKAIFVCQNAPMTCQIWFACHGCLICTRRAIKSEICVHAAHPLLLDSDTNTEELENNRVDSFTLKQSSFTDHEPEAGPTDGISDLAVAQNPVKVEADADTEKGVTGNLNWQSMEVLLDSSTLIESLTDEAKASERAEQDAENQYDALMQELQMVQGQNSLLEIQLAKSQSEVKDLEEKIVSAVKLLITMKERRDKLRTGNEDAARAVKNLKNLAKIKAKSLLGPQFLAFSFLEITEATHNFHVSQMIGGGRYGNVYKGFLHHMQVSIKMLPSYAFLSDLEFQHLVEHVSRARHPNMVTLVGTCPESRTLVYEYFKNGSLEGRLTCRGNTPPLSWQTRTQIAINICSALIFLHSNSPYVVHGNLRPSKVLLDANFSSKLAYLGFSPSPSLNSIYTDPEFLETGKLTPESDVYSFGIIMLRLLTARPVLGIIKDVKCALENGTFNVVMDLSAGEWPLEQAIKMAHMALRCCEKSRFNRPDLASEVLSVLQLKPSTASVTCLASKRNRRIPPYFVCPIIQEIMEDPVIATDGFTYEAEAIQGWFNSGHNTSPMTNLELEDCNLLPNHALHYAIQEWLHQ